MSFADKERAGLMYGWKCVQKLLMVCFEGLAKLSGRVRTFFLPRLRHLSSTPSLHRASTDALILWSKSHSRMHNPQFDVNTIHISIDW